MNDHSFEIFLLTNIPYLHDQYALIFFTRDDHNHGDDGDYGDDVCLVFCLHRFLLLHVYSYDEGEYRKAFVPFLTTFSLLHE